MNLREKSILRLWKLVIVRSNPLAEMGHVRYKIYCIRNKFHSDNNDCVNRKIAYRMCPNAKGRNRKV